MRNGPGGSPTLIAPSAPSGPGPTLTAQMANAWPAFPSTYRTLGRFCGPIRRSSRTNRPRKTTLRPTATRRGGKTLGRLGRLGRFLEPHGTPRIVPRAGIERRPHWRLERVHELVSVAV